MHLQTLAIGSQLLIAVTAHRFHHLSQRDDASKKVDVNLLGRNYGLRYNVDVSLGGSSQEVLVDTGSSDLFVVADDFECIYNSRIVSSSICGWDSALYEPTDTFEEISDEVFVAAYGAGQASGEMAYEDITLGGITVTRQKFGYVNASEPMGFGGSGVLGMAYPFGTSAYETNSSDSDPDYYTEDEREIYNPLFVNMFMRNLTNPYFSLALNRLSSDEQSSSDAGYLTLGGLPPVDVDGNYTTVPAEFYDTATLSNSSTRRRLYWATTVQEVVFGDSTNTTSWQAIVDSGAPVNTFPKPMAEQINKMFDPPGTYSSQQGAYMIECDATPPTITVKLGGRAFTLNPADLILQSGLGFCLSGIAPGLSIDLGNGETTSDYHILGLPFLKGVVSVFDFGNHEMRFAVRKDAEEGASTRLTATTGACLFGLTTALWLMESLF